MSYTATNLLFDMGPGEPVQDEEVDSHWLTNCKCCTGASDSHRDLDLHSNNLGVSGSSSSPGKDADSATDQQPLTQQGRRGADSATEQQLLSQQARRGADSASSAYGTATAAQNISNAQHTATSKADDVKLSIDCAEGTGNFTENKAARLSSQSEDCEARSEASRRSASGDDSPPFLMYKWPKGLRGWSIIALLIGQAGPCTAILAMLTIGKYKNMPELYMEDVRKYSTCLVTLLTLSRCNTRYIT